MRDRVILRGRLFHAEFEIDGRKFRSIPLKLMARGVPPGPFEVEGDLQYELSKKEAEQAASLMKEEFRRQLQEGKEPHWRIRPAVTAKKEPLKLEALVGMWESLCSTELPPSPGGRTKVAKREAHAPEYRKQLKAWLIELVEFLRKKKGLTYADEVTKEHVQEFMDEKWDSGGVANTHNNILTGLRSAFRRLVIGEVINSNPFEKLDTLADDAGLSFHREAFTEKEAELICDRADALVHEETTVIFVPKGERKERRPKGTQANDAESAKQKRRERKRTEHPEGMQKVIKKSRRQQERDKLVRILIVVMLCTAMREANAATLKWGDVNLDLETINVLPDKGGDRVTIPIFPRLLAVLKEAAAALPPGAKIDKDAFVFPALARQQESNMKRIRDAFYQIALDVGFKREDLVATTNGRKRAASIRGLHSLRTTFITLALAHGLPAATITLITGHKDTAMVLGPYNRQQTETIRAQFKGKMARILGWANAHSSVPARPTVSMKARLAATLQFMKPADEYIAASHGDLLSIVEGLTGPCDLKREIRDGITALTKDNLPVWRDRLLVLIAQLPES